MNLDDAYDNYEGQIKDFVCGAILEIKTEDGNLKSVNLARVEPNQSGRRAFEHAANRPLRT